MEIKKRTYRRYTERRTSKIKWLAIHYTGSTHSEPGSAFDTADYFGKTAPRAASADFITDDKYAVQYNPDITGRFTYAVGGKGNPKKYKMSTHLGGRYYGTITNANSISIEMRSSKVNKKSVEDSDKDWYITEATLNTTAKLAAYLLKKYNIPFNHMVMHHEISYYGKLCPLPFCQKESDLSKWEDFKKRVKKEMNGGKVNKNPATKDAIKGESEKDRFIRTFGYWCNKDLGTSFENKPQFDKLKEVIAKNNLVKGCKHKGMVEHLQYWIVKLGIAKIDVDGSFGDATFKAVKKLQEKCGCKQDGEFGSGTLEKMVAKLFK